MKESKGYKYAQVHVGLEEKEDKDKLIKLFARVGINCNPATTAWCAAFVNTMERLAGNITLGKLNARSFLTYGTAVSNWDDAQEGDIVVFQRGNSSWEGHVAYFVKWEDEHNTVKVLGGNQSDKVCYASYRQDAILDIRRTPDAN